MLRNSLIEFDAKFRAVIETTPDTIIIIDESNTIVFCNKNIKKTFGYEQEELLNQNMVILIPPDQKEAHLKGMRRFLNTRVPKLIGKTIEVKGLRKDGSIFPMDLSLSYWEEDNKIYFSSIIRDISERKRTQQELEVLVSISQAISNSEDFYSALRITMEKACQLTGFVYSEAWVPFDNSLIHSPVTVYVSEKYKELEKVSKSYIFASGEGIPGKVFENNKVIWIKDLSESTEYFPRMKYFKEAGFTSGLGIPISVNDSQVFASLIFFSNESIEENEYLINVITSITKQLGIFLKSKQAEEKLKISEEDFRFLAENSSDMITRATPEGVLLYISPSCENMMGFSQKDLMGKSVYDFFHPVDLFKMQKTPDAILKTLNKSTITFRLKRKSGDYIWAESTRKVLLSSNGEIQEIHATTRDITERKKQEEEIKKSIDFYLTILQDFPALIWRTNTSGTFDYFNRTFLEFRGHDFEEELLMDWKKEIHSEEREAFLKKFNNAFKNKETFTNEFRIKNKEDQYRWLLNIGKPIFDLKNKFVGYLGACYDISEQKSIQLELKEAYEALKETNADLVLTEELLKEANNDLEYKVKERTQEVTQIAQRFKFLAETIPQLVWSTNKDGVVDYFNKQWFDYTGQDKQDSKKWGWSSVIHPDDLERTLNLWTNCIKEGCDYSIEYRLKKHDGTYRWFLGRGKPFTDSSGKIIKWFGTCTDIQDHKEALENLEKTQHGLNLINLELSVKNEELLRTNNDLDNFIYTASHDLKAPISNIEGLINAIKTTQGYIDEELQNLIQMIDFSINKFKNTITDLTEITKVQKGIIEDQEKIDIRDIITEVKLSIKNLIEVSNTNLKIQIKDSPFIKFSRKNLRSIVYNLLSNAIKYRSPDRPSKVTLQLKTTEDFIVLSVEDNGLGMDLKRSNKIFSMFKRLHSHVEGSGIGLYIVKRIVDNAGGKIEVESKVDKGSTFRVYLKK